MSAGNAAEAFLQIRGLTKRFGSFTALHEIDFDVAEGEFVCFLGPSGCGKTTLLRAIAGLDVQTTGTIHQAGRDVSALPPAARDFGIVFQSYALFPNLNVMRNIAYGLENAGLGRVEVKRRVSELLELVGLPEQGPKFPAQLSGGQQQRVAVARALATSPGLLLLDEPLSALDAQVRVHLRQEIKALQQRLGITTIMVTHDQEEALSVADRIVVMNDGVIEQVGTPTQIYREPDSLFVADFIGETNRLSAVAEAADALRIGAQAVRAARSCVPDAGPLVAVIRPEDIIVADLGQPLGADGENSFEATVTSLEFLGASWRLRMDCPALAAADLNVNVSVNAARDLAVARHMVLNVQLPRERILVFPAGD